MPARPSYGRGGEGKEIIAHFFSYEQYCIDAAVHFTIVLRSTSSVRIHMPFVGGGMEKRTVIWAYLPQITLPPAVTIPSSLLVKSLEAVCPLRGWGGMRAYLTLHSIIVPLLSTPSCVYMGFCGFCVSS